MKCKQCNTGLTGRQREFCSDKCRMAMNRGTKANEVGSGSPKANRDAVEPEQNESEQLTRTALQLANADKMVVERGQSERGQTTNVRVDGVCYRRPTIACREFDTRPVPVEPTDQPVHLNRGRYKRVDGTVYQFDCQGQHFECKHPFKDRYGKPHLAVYETVADVRQAAGTAPVHEQGASQA